MHIKRQERNGVVLLGGQVGQIRFGFTERGGGVSEAPYSSLNLATHVGDNPRAVAENRRRALALLSDSAKLEDVLVPNQVHGSTIVVVNKETAQNRAHLCQQLSQGADAVVCSTSHVPVLLCFADCVPVILLAPGGFAVVHSGWKGTLARISARAATVLAEETHASPSDICAYIGPHIQGDEYEVSPELIEQFAAEFYAVEHTGHKPCLLNLSACIKEALIDCGVPKEVIVDTGLSTMKHNDRFFSYRSEAGECGRHGALAILE
ncbi:polyphenol oxidase family protein [Collinsella sp. zg1085]|uniref:polyphenol oxidase family protein n=1 Tax=Collinsella sp. zg1085 TaxID=2844380 RepID=UPI001C0CACF6|nr:polyphenol oxidase family protein [Collinsella sp. zg1085]QWT18048.1 polyphenol oxidase family protein [Collinsella sp. zg1085]